MEPDEGETPVFVATQSPASDVPAFTFEADPDLGIEKRVIFDAAVAGDAEVGLRAQGYTEDEIARSEPLIRNADAMMQAVSKDTEAGIRQGLSALAGLLPGNPRSIKRIINMASAYQVSATVVFGRDFRPGQERWRQLIMFVVLSSERPRIWEALLRERDLADRVCACLEPGADWPDLPGKPEDDVHEAARDRRALAILRDDGALGLLRTEAIPDPDGTSVTTRLTEDALADFRILMPLKARS